MEGVTIFAGKSGVIRGTGKLVIKDFLDVKSVYPPEKWVESDKFMVGEVPMTIQVFPNGDDEENKGTVSVFLANKSNEDVTVNCLFVTDEQEAEFKMITISHRDDANCYGFPDFLDHSECEAAFKDKDFIVTAKVEIAGEMTKLFGSSHLTSASKKRKFNVLEDVYKRMDLTDFTLVFEGKEVVDNNLKQFNTV